MKVQNKIATPTNSDTTSTNKASKGTKPDPSILFGEGVKSSRVEISERAQDTKRAKDIARQGLNEVDEQKVAKFQALVDAGKYKVDASKVADKMVDEHLSNELAAHETDV